MLLCICTGRAWTCDFGCSENEEEFHWLIKYDTLFCSFSDERWAKLIKLCFDLPLLLLTAE